MRIKFWPHGEILKWGLFGRTGLGRLYDCLMQWALFLLSEKEKGKKIWQKVMIPRKM
jgi:hypothetical protein